MDFHAVVVVGVEVTQKDLKALDREQYAEFLDVDVEVIDECWAEEDEMDLAEARPASLRVFYVEDMVDLCYGGTTRALAIPLADFEFEFRNKPYYVNRRLAFSAEEITAAFALAAEHLSHTGLTVNAEDIRLFTPVTYSAT